jgi:hypothetical protein
MTRKKWKRIGPNCEEMEALHIGKRDSHLYGSSSIAILANTKQNKAVLPFQEDGFCATIRPCNQIQEDNK